jgi:hypothetical protein
MTKETTMKEKVARQGGLFSCDYKTEDGKCRSNVCVRAHDAAEARSKLERVLGCVLVAFTVNAFCA